jgi:hypothetical protein
MGMRVATNLSATVLLIGLTAAACSDVGIGFKNHPADCALGVAWADCLPGTPGYRGTPAQLAYQGVTNRQEDEAAQRDRRMQAASDEARRCVEKRKAGELADHVASATCINDAMERGFSEVRYPHMDLVRVISATRLRAAEQIDSGEITEGEAVVRIAEKISDITSEERRRRAEDIQTNAAATRAYAQARSAEAQARAAKAREDAARQLEYLRLLQPAPAPALVPAPIAPRPRRTTSNTIRYDTPRYFTQEPAGHAGAWDVTPGHYAGAALPKLPRTGKKVQNKAPLQLPPLVRETSDWGKLP